MNIDVKLWDHNVLYCCQNDQFEKQYGNIRVSDVYIILNVYDTMWTYVYVYSRLNTMCNITVATEGL